MTLAAHLAQKQDAIWESWRKAVFDSYPERAAKFFGRVKDDFSNPVGQTISEGTRVIVEALVAGELDSSDQVREHLEKIIKIRSIQDFSASEAVCFVYDLRDVLRQHLRADLQQDAQLASELRAFEDGPLVKLVLQAFDIYASCRERLYNVRVNELKRSVHSLLRRFQDPGLPAICGGQGGPGGNGEQEPS